MKILVIEGIEYVPKSELEGARKEAWWTFQKAMLWLVNHKKPQTAQPCLCLALGFTLAIGVKTQAELATKLGLTKADISKCVTDINRKVLDLPD